MYHKMQLAVYMIIFNFFFNRPGFCYFKNKMVHVCKRPDIYYAYNLFLRPPASATWRGACLLDNLDNLEII
jgi:hypothetical protein